MYRDLINKVVVITGGAEGIGYEVAGKYLEKGAKVTILLDINEKLGAEAVKKINAKYGQNKAVFMKCDVTTDLNAITSKIFNLYKVDVLVNNAGILNDTLLRKTIDINVTAVIEWSLKFWEHMRTDKGGNGGAIINLSSICGFRVEEHLPVYHASKFAVMGFTRSLGHVANYERSGVRVVAICPGFTESNMSTSTQSVTWDPAQNDEYRKFKQVQVWQKLDAVGNAAVEIFQKAISGTAWLIEGAIPIVEVTV